MKSKVNDPEVSIPQDKVERQIGSQPSLQMSDLIGSGVTSSKNVEKSTVVTPSGNIKEKANGIQKKTPLITQKEETMPVAKE